MSIPFTARPKNLCAVLLSAALVVPLSPPAQAAADSVELHWLPENTKLFLNSDDASKASGGCGVIAVEDEHYKLGYVDGAGNIIVPPAYDFGLTGFQADRPWLDLSILIQNTTCCIVNPLGQILAQFSVTPETTHQNFLGFYSDNLCPIEQYGSWGYINTAGEMVIPCRYEDAKPFCDGFAAVKQGNKWHFIDASGQMVNSLEYDDVWYPQEGLALVEKDGKYGYVSSAGELVIPLQYDDAYFFNEGLAVVEQGGKCGYINTFGQMVIPAIYAYACDFSGGMALVSQDNQYVGYINASGQMTIPEVWTDAYDFKEGFAVVGQGGKYGYVDAAGRMIAPLVYDNAFDFNEGLAVVCQNGKYGCINAAGETVIPLVYDSLGDFHKGIAWAGLGEKYGFINTENGIVVPLQYDNAGFTRDYTVAYVRAGSRYAVFVPPALLESEFRQAVAYASLQQVDVDGKKVPFQMYALKDGNGNPTNYIKIRDLAQALSGSPAGFSVTWNGAVALERNAAYIPDGSEGQTPFSGDRFCQPLSGDTLVNGTPVHLDGIVLHDDNGGGYVYYQLRDLGRALSFNVGWSEERGMFIETNRIYDENN